MTPRKIIKWTLAIGDEDDICLPFGTSVDEDTYGNSEAVNVVDIAVVFKLIEALRDIVYKDEIDCVPSKTFFQNEFCKSQNLAKKTLKLADIIMDEFTDKI